MATTTFIPGTRITAEWLNETDAIVHDVFGAATTAAAALVALGVNATATELNELAVVVNIADLSADATYYVVMPHAGNITQLYSVIDGAVSTADVTITPSISGTPITDGAITITQSGSAAGDVDSATPSAANTVTAGQAISLAVTGGGAGGSPRGTVTIILTRT